MTTSSLFSPEYEEKARGVQQRSLVCVAWADFALAVVARMGRKMDAELTLSEAREILGLNSQASIEDARRAYRQLALRHHPDKSAEPDAKARFQRINDAWMRLQAWHEDQEEEQTAAAVDDTAADDDPQLQAQLERQRQAFDRAERDALDQLDSSIRQQQFSGGWFFDTRDWAEYEYVNRASIGEHFETQRQVSEVAAVSSWTVNRALRQADAAISQGKFAAATRLLTRAIEEIREADKESAHRVKFDAQLEPDVLFKRSQCYSQLDSEWPFRTWESHPICTGPACPRADLALASRSDSA